MMLESTPHRRRDDCSRLRQLRAAETGPDIETPCCGEWPRLQQATADHSLPYGRTEGSLPQVIRSRFECPECEREWYANYHLVDSSLRTSEVSIARYLGIGAQHQWWLRQRGREEVPVAYQFVSFEAASSLPEQEI